MNAGSDQIWVSLITMFGSICTAAIGAFIAIKTIAIKNVADNAAKVATDTHTLVNSNMGVQLKLNRDLSKRVADSSGNEQDRAVANLAEQMYLEHIKKQAIVDANLISPNPLPVNPVKL
jgi:hypothetical protein